MPLLRQKIDRHNVVGQSKGVNQVSSCAETGSQSLATATSERDFANNVIWPQETCL